MIDFAITVWKSQGGTFEYIIALLEHSPGSPPLTSESDSKVIFMGHEIVKLL